MSFIKKQSAGFYLSALSALLGAVGLAFYFINCNTAYFRSAGTNPAVIGCLAAAVLLELVLIAAAQKGQPLWTDALPVAAPVLLILGFVFFITNRVNAMAAIMTFTNNAQNMADLSSAFVALGASLLGAVAAIAGAFLPIIKE